MRKLASIRKIKNIIQHPNADMLEIAEVDGWRVVVKKGEHKVGDVVVYCEIDSVLPVRPEFEFLRKSCYVKKDWLETPNCEGFRIKTIKLRGEFSQGLILSLNVLPKEFLENHQIEIGTDVTDVLGIKKYEEPLSAQLSGKVKGRFPNFIPKTEQERIQNLYDSFREDVLENTYFYITLKLDGTSFTAFKNGNDFGVCSRNYELYENDDNIYSKVFIEYGIKKFLEFYGLNVAIQGEICGVGVQGNPYHFKNLFLFIFDVFDIDKQRYFNYSELNEFYGVLDKWLENNKEFKGKVFYTPYILPEDFLNDTMFLLGKGLKDLDVLQEETNKLKLKNIGPIYECYSNNANLEKYIEGLVFKSVDRTISFKVINQNYIS